ncbi:MAG: hypothetical protein V4789_23320 [Burkholderia gladioli]
MKRIKVHFEFNGACRPASSPCRRRWRPSPCRWCCWCRIARRIALRRSRGDALDTAEQALLRQFGRVRLAELARRVKAAAG